MDFIELLQKPNKSMEEKVFVYKNQIHLYLRWTDSSMNVLCRYIENIERDFRFARRTCHFDYKCLMTCDLSELDESKVKRCYDIAKIHDAKFRKFARDNYLYRTMTNSNYSDVEEDARNRMESQNEKLRQEIAAICPDDEVANYMVYVYYGIGTKLDKNTLWNVFGNFVADNVRQTATHRYKFQESENGVTYLNKKLELIDECG